MNLKLYSAECGTHSSTHNFYTRLSSSSPPRTLLESLGTRPGLKMPIAGIGMWGYAHVKGTGIPGDVWKDIMAEIAVKENG